MRKGWKIGLALGGLVAVGAATPSPAPAGAPVLFTVAVSATSPPSPPTGVSVLINMSSIGGSATPPFSRAIAASFQFVIRPRNISASSGPVNFRSRGTPGTL